LAILALVAISLMSGCANPQQSFELEEGICFDSQLFPLLDWKIGGYIQKDELLQIAQKLNEENSKVSEEGKSIQIGYFNYYKEKVNNPPFQYPAELLCQTLKFKKASDAVLFEKSLKTTRSSLAITGPGLGYENSISISQIDLMNGEMSISSIYEIRLSSGGNRFLIVTVHKQYVFITHYGNIETPVAQGIAIEFHNRILSKIDSQVK
tara:strand:- start:1815 stop:2438 length:624 start_codon:yes stop_codon:yes gene_type:complete